MQLDALEIRNYRSFSDSEFRFNPRLNLIVGANGSGKSSLLSAISASLVHPMSAFKFDMSVRAIEPSDVRFETSVIDNKVRFERRFPVYVGATGVFFDRSLKWNTSVKSEAVGGDSSHDLWMLFSQIKDRLDAEPPVSLPLVAFYNAQRSGRRGRSSLEEAASIRLSRFDGYESWGDSFVDRGDLENWVIGKTLERLQALSEGSGSLDEQKDELTIVNRALLGCLPQAKALRYDLRLRSLMVEFSEGAAVPFSSLSDGQQGMILLVSDIARRMCILNPHLGERVLSETDGLLVVDEIDIHLHPEWQRRILRVLTEAFPRIQIFATSHSPQMIGGLSPDQVIILRDGQAYHPPYSYGLDVNELLEDVMGSKSRDPKVDETIRTIFVKIENSDLAGAKALLAELKLSAPGLPDYSRAEALIRRKQVLDR